MYVAPAVFRLSTPFMISTFNVKQCVKDTMKLIFLNMFYLNLIFFFKYGKGVTTFNLTRDTYQTLKWTTL